MTYTRIRECRSFWAWLLCSWDFRDHWEGPYILWRKSGVRVFGFEFERLYRKMADD